MNARGVFSTSNFFSNAAAQVSSGDLSIAAWLYPLAVGPATIWGVCGAADDAHFVQLTVRSTGQVRFQFRDGATNRYTDTTGTVTLNKWNLIGGACSSVGIDRKAWLALSTPEYVTSGAEEPMSWPTVTRTAMGIRWSQTLAQAFNGYIGPLGVWAGTILSVEEVWYLAGARNFRSMTTHPPTAYYESEGTAGVSDLVGSFDFTEEGTVAETAGPRIRRTAIGFGRFESGGGITVARRRIFKGR